MVYGAGKGNMQNQDRVGTVYYNRGVGAAAMWIEALKNAQKMHNKGKTVNGAEFATATRRSTSPMRSSRSWASTACRPLQDVVREARRLWSAWTCSGTARSSRWCRIVPAPDPKFIRMIEESAEKYAKENNITRVSARKRRSARRAQCGIGGRAGALPLIAWARYEGNCHE